MNGILEKYLGEILVGAALIIFGWAFRNWSGTIKKTSSEVLSKLERLIAEFHNHKLDVEHRVTSVEKDVERLKDEK